MWKKRLLAFVLIVIAGWVAYGADFRVDLHKQYPFATVSVVEPLRYKLGLDLNGGIHLVYKADTSKVPAGEVASAMSALRDVIERRVNLFGVSEPLVQTEQGGVIGNGENRLIVELPGVTDLDTAIKLIGQIPVLEFRLLSDDAKNLKPEELQKKPVNEIFVPTELTGRFLEKAQLNFDQRTGEPRVSLTFNAEGQKLFSKITKENIGRVLAIFLDGAPISTPVIRQEITGDAEISGGFRVEEARLLARNLNYGALPVQISLVSTQTVGASLGANALDAGVRSGIIAYIIIAIFLIFWYRLPGLVASISLLVYVVINLFIFKYLVTLTAAGIAGFILSIGMAVDANILIFERMKEEFARGRVLSDAISEGFARAWTSIRDSNFSSIITAVILYWFASTSLIKGFALVFFIGVVSSMFTAIVVSRTLLTALGAKGHGAVSKFLFGSGFFTAKSESAHTA